MTTTVPMPTNFRDFYSILNDNKKLRMFVREQKLILESEDHQCPKCGSEMRDGKRQKTLKDDTVSTYEIMRCKNKQCANQLSKRKNIFFAFTDSLGRANSKLSVASILEIIWLWCFNITSKTISWTVGCSEATTVDWCNFLREVCTENIPWMFGIAQPTENGYEVRFFHVQRRDRATLVPIILKHVVPGTTVWSDEWGAYKNLQTQYGCDHQTVNHSQNFVDPHTGCHTQLIECLWGQAKTKILRAMRGSTLLDSHLNEFWYRSVHKDMFSSILTDIRRFRITTPMAESLKTASEFALFQCPITHQLFKDPVLAEDGHTYEREAIVQWIQKNGTSPITRQLLSIDQLHPNCTIKNIVNELRSKKFYFKLGVHVKKKSCRALFQAHGKTVWEADWIGERGQPICLMKINGVKALKEASFYEQMTRHPYIVKTYGIVDEASEVTSYSIMLLQEYASEGNLFELLQEQPSVPKEHILCEMFVQISDAMVFLAHNQIVHGDLAYFGLSRGSSMYAPVGAASTTTMTIVPIRYAAPEVLSNSNNRNSYTAKSDMFSMGVLMWEGYSKGEMPWSNIEKDDEVSRKVMNGERLEQPSKCNDRVWSMVLKCMSQQANDRPLFEELKRHILGFMLGSAYTPAPTPLRGTDNDIPDNAKWTQNGVTVAGGSGQGNMLNQLSYPSGLYVDDAETVYVTEWNNDRIVEWKSGATSGQVIAGGNGKGNRMDQLNFPTDVIVDKERDTLIICDRGNKRVVRWPRRNGTSGQTIISDVDCNGLTMDDRGFLYVSDTGKNDVKRWRVGDTCGTTVAGGNGKGDRLDQLNDPYYVFVDREHSVYVSDNKNHRVMKWVEGAKEAIVVAGDRGQGKGLAQLSHPLALVVDQFGSIYVADTGNARIIRWHKGATQGSVIVGGNGEGKQANQLNRPNGLSFDRHGNLYVVEENNHRVQKFNIDASSSS
ncbi:unnamed protein product [Didymodactylos carnosus]|uniref:Uncharacterized protein n=1 Tax=Didymodactylos carnosus TaxID=1234261 RepID=A0A814L5B0_9BILA|nr:unnamed protein product [Didymodactylos carnosus]CAF1061352.1 unnamed protein product [Didymodactylos carnosus]CAF3504048.1 unnamed protein product [Didymodactylos carnosus]CAF3829637.1 unnamed protein product [Didymodactylos carnosus]